MQLPNSWDLVIAGGFVAGLLLFVASSALMRASERREKVAKTNLAWPKLVDEDLTAADAAVRLEMVERLAMVPGAWSRGILEQAQREENDGDVRSAIDRALGAAAKT